jgi:diamine N-acetyltransferase
MSKIADTWQTSRLSVNTSLLEEAPDLLEVFNSCAYVEPWDPTFKPVLLEEIAGLISTSLGIGEKIDERFLIQTIRHKETGEVIGYFHIYHSVPHPNTVFMSMFVVRPELQKHHFGQEAFEGLVEQVREAGGWKAVWLQVYLKNWPAMRFWVRNGFTRIIEMRGDSIHEQNSHAAVVLEKII